MAGMFEGFDPSRNSYALGEMLGKGAGMIGDAMGVTPGAQARARNDALFSNAFGAPQAAPQAVQGDPSGQAGLPAPGGSAPHAQPQGQPQAQPQTYADGINISNQDLLNVMRDHYSSPEDRAIAQGIYQRRSAPKKRDIHEVGGALVEVGDNGAKELYRAPTAPDKGTAQFQNYQIAQRDPAYAKFLTDNKPGTNVTVAGPEKAFNQAVGKGYGERFMDIQKEGSAASSSLAALGQMEKLTQSPNFKSGFGNEYQLGADKFAVWLGADKNLVKDREAFAALANKAAMEALGGKLGAGVSDTDVNFITGMGPKLDQSPEGIRLNIGIQTRIARRRQEIAQFARQYAAQHDGQIDAGFDQVVADYNTAHPMFADLASTVEAPAGAQGGAPPAGEYDYVPGKGLVPRGQ